jgi:hypothetical protein
MVHIVRLTYMDVNDLQINNRGKIEPIPCWWKELLKTFISLYHDICHKAKRDLHPEHFSQRMFIDYSLCDFNMAGHADVPWSDEGETKELICTKSPKWYLMHSTSCHLIDPQYTPIDLETHSKESTWVYGLLGTSDWKFDQNEIVMMSWSLNFEACGFGINCGFKIWRGSKQWHPGRV